MEHQHHLDRPASDPAHLGQALDDFGIIEPFELAPFGHDAFERLRGEILKGSDLCKREADGAQLRVLRGKYCPWRREAAAAASRGEASEDGPRGVPVQLLVCDGTRKRLKGRALALQLDAAWADYPDQAPHHRIDSGQMCEALVSHVLGRSTLAAGTVIRRPLPLRLRSDGRAADTAGLGG